MSKDPEEVNKLTESTYKVSKTRIIQDKRSPCATYSIQTGAPSPCLLT